MFNYLTKIGNILKFVIEIQLFRCYNHDKECQTDGKYCKNSHHKGGGFL